MSFSDLVYPFEWIVSWILYRLAQRCSPRWASPCDSGFAWAPPSSASWSSCGPR